MYISPLRRKIPDEDSVVTFKMCSWSGVKIEGWSTTPTTTSSTKGGGKAASSNEGLLGAVLRMIANETKIRIAFKRNMSDSSLMCTRISVHLGDVIWILTQSQLRALSRLVQTLMDAAVKSAQRMRERRERKRVKGQQVVWNRWRVFLVTFLSATNSHLIRKSNSANSKQRKIEKCPQRSARKPQQPMRS